MNQRDQSLDALRGFAILAMVLSGSIAFGVLPAWMYHAQVPPPKHEFISSLPGITWVDLVFPFFLFSMGAAIPLSLAKLEKEGASLEKVLWIAGRRYVLLTFFALFTVHMRAGMMASPPAVSDYLLSILGFLLLCFQFYEYKGEKHKSLFLALRILAFAAAALLLYFLPFKDDKGFSLTRVDVIILVLGNMAFFGTVIWWLTRHNPLLRVALLPFVMAVFLGAKEKGSWNEAFFNYSPLPWMYKFYYLKYLFIIIPGTLAGEWLLQSVQQKDKEVGKQALTLISFLSIGLVICNVWLLFNRSLLLNLSLSIALSLLIFFLIKRSNALQGKLYKFAQAGFYLLLLGLFFEAYEGGIKKDFSTYSYYFITAGLSFFMLIALYGLQRTKVGAHMVQYLGANGRNPMVAYVAGNLLVIPLLHLTGGMELLNSFSAVSVWTGFLRGIIFTGIVSLITLFFVKRKWFWKT
jgi:predicted acyltransferase